MLEGNSQLLYKWSKLILMMTSVNIFRKSSDLCSCREIFCLLSFVPPLGQINLRGGPFDFWGGWGGVGKFWKKSSCNPMRKKKIVWHTVEKKIPARRAPEQKNSTMGEKYLACSSGQKKILHGLNLLTPSPPLQNFKRTFPNKPGNGN